MGKISVEKAYDRPRHDPLHVEIGSMGGNLRKKPRNGRGNREKSADAQDESFIDAARSRKILLLAKEQQDELEQEEQEQDMPMNTFGESLQAQVNYLGEDVSSQSLEEDFDLEEVEECTVEEGTFNEEEARLFQWYFQGNGRAGDQPINLADKILEKIQERELEMLGHQVHAKDGVLLPPKVIAAYEKIGQVLSTYKHGKLPKLFKVLPTLNNWEDVLYVTNPEAWTPNAVYEATKLFVSNLQAPQAQKFIKLVLLERFQTSIEMSQDHTLNYHIYQALKKSLYKPAAFFKGFLLPLVDSCCTVREATIASSVIAKVSVPVLHSSVALTQLLQRDFSPSTTIFIRVLIEKQYALPYQTIDELVYYFMRFRDASQGQELMHEEGDVKAPQLPIVWHKAFLAFAQRYKNDITDDQRDFLLETVRQRFHKGIGPEIRRELLAGQPRTCATSLKDATLVDVF